MTPQPDQQAIAMHRLTNVSRRKGNQTMKFSQLIEHNMKFSQLIEHNMRSIFLEKLYKNMVEELFPDLFLKN